MIRIAGLLLVTLCSACVSTPRTEPSPFPHQTLKLMGDPPAHFVVRGTTPVQEQDLFVWCDDAEAAAGVARHHSTTVWMNRGGISILGMGAVGLAYSVAAPGDAPLARQRSAVMIASSGVTALGAWVLFESLRRATSTAPVIDADVTQAAVDRCNGTAR